MPVWERRHTPDRKKKRAVRVIPQNKYSVLNETCFCMIWRQKNNKASPVHSFFSPSIQVTVTETTGQAHPSSVSPAASSSCSRSEALSRLFWKVSLQEVLGRSPRLLTVSPGWNTFKGRCQGGAGGQLSVRLKERQAECCCPVI